MDNHCDSDQWTSVPVCNNMCYHQDYSGDVGELSDYKVT